MYTDNGHMSHFDRGAYCHCEGSAARTRHCEEPTGHVNHIERADKYVLTEMGGCVIISRRRIDNDKNMREGQ